MEQSVLLEIKDLRENWKGKDKKMRRSGTSAEAAPKRKIRDRKTGKFSTKLFDKIFPN